MNLKLPVNSRTLLIRTIEMHTGGEPLRVIVEGFPKIQGDSVLACRNYVLSNLDHLRKTLMWEPRGHADMYGCLIVPSNDDGAAFGVIFMHNSGYSTMCGHATIALGRLAAKLGWAKPPTENNGAINFNIDAPCGRLKLEVNDGEVSFIGVPSFLLYQNEEIILDDGHKIKFDVAYGGAFYAYVDIEETAMALIPENYAKIKKLGGLIKRAIIKSGLKILHPIEEDLSFLYGVIFIGGPVSPGIGSRNVCVFADEEVDRCPTGSGVMGRLALHFAKKEIGLNEVITVESIVGSVFKGSVLESVKFGPHDAIIPQVNGNAYITGENVFHIDPEDPLAGGFILH